MSLLLLAFKGKKKIIFCNHTYDPSWEYETRFYVKNILILKLLFTNSILLIKKFKLKIPGSTFYDVSFFVHVLKGPNIFLSDVFLYN